MLLNSLLFSLNCTINVTLLLAFSLIGIPRLAGIRMFTAIRTPDLTPLCRHGYSLVSMSYYTRNTQLTLAFQINIYSDSYNILLMENLPIIQKCLKTSRFILSSKNLAICVKMLSGNCLNSNENYFNGILLMRMNKSINIC